MSYRWLVLRFDAPSHGLWWRCGGSDRSGPGLSRGLYAHRIDWQRARLALVGPCRAPSHSGSAHIRRTPEREGVLLTDMQTRNSLRPTRAGRRTAHRKDATVQAIKPPTGDNAEYHADLSVRVVMRLAPAEEPPTLDELADAIDRPARPLFLGRKSCLPSTPLLAEGSDRWIVGDTAYAALRAVPGGHETATCIVARRRGTGRGRRLRIPYCRSSRPAKLAHGSAQRIAPHSGGPDNSGTSRMTALHLIRVSVDTHALVRWAQERGWVRGRVVAFDEGRALHHLVDEVVGPGVLRPFRLLVHLGRPRAISMRIPRWMLSPYAPTHKYRLYRST